MMRRYLGKNFYNASTPALLLVSESHYLPKDSQATTTDAWYSGNLDTLSEEETRHINTSQIIDRSRAESFTNRAHSIYKNALWEINRYGPCYADYRRVADDIAFCNFFLRPAVYGKSLVVTPQDVSIANEHFLHCSMSLGPLLWSFSRPTH